MWIYAILISLYHLSPIAESKGTFYSGSRQTVRAAALDTMTLLVSKNNNYYYYLGKLEGDASNFKSGSSRSIKEVAEMHFRSSGTGRFVIVIKTDRKPTLKNHTKEMLSFLQQKYNCVSSYFSTVESQLIDKVEKNLAN